MKVSPASGSVVEKVPTTVLMGWFSATLEGLRAMAVGAGSTVNRQILERPVPLALTAVTAQ